ncbi:hypothetical protein EWH23_08720 [Meiothermus sp. PNK-Is4]|nr:hypothetical protein DNA98_06485 [Meiothermus sp. Pnk-1]RYM36743.1 hypothetical protein EWH23_08720 [Meiothermus sp. PNK-Is4]
MAGFDPGEIVALATLEVQERGYALFGQGRVLEGTRQGQRYSARVQGSAPYPYRTWIDLKKQDWGCTCPYAWGPVCKHVVAVAYAIQEAPELFQAKRKRKKTTDPGQLALQELPDEDLLELLWELAEQRPELMEEFAYNLLQRAE